MFFFIGGTREKELGRERRNVHFRGKSQMADVTVFKSYFHLFWIPVIPLGKRYAIYLLDDGAFYMQDLFNKMPAELLEQCKEVGRKF